VRPDGTELEVDADDTSNLLVRTESGALAVISVTASALHTASTYRFEAYGSDGSITIDGSLFGGTVRAGRVGDDGLLPLDVAERMPRSGREIPSRRAGNAIRMMALMLEDWLPAFAGERSVVPTLRDGLGVERVVAAARRSSEGAGWVPF
jgi:predicted dehydrogenase